MFNKGQKMAGKYGLDFYCEPIFWEEFIPKAWTCPWETIYIGFDGEIYPCPAGEVLFKDKMERGVYASGNLLSQNIEQVWNNEFFIKLRKTDGCGGGPFLIKECSCCGNSINWLGPDDIRSHILDWSSLGEDI